MKIIILIFLILISISCIFSQEIKIRKQVDTIGFASNFENLKEFIKRANESNEKYLNDDIKKIVNDNNTSWKLAICPHDDYTYVGGLYPALLKGIKAKTVIIFGVCHKAKMFGLENKIIFDLFDKWKTGGRLTDVSVLRNEIINLLPKDTYIIYDSVQAVEHSVEAIIPFLKYYNPEVKIISILVPYMNYTKMNEIANPLSDVIIYVMKNNNLKWGEDIAMVISNDAVHYGDTLWGGNDFSFCGKFQEGYQNAIKHEKEIIQNCLTNELSKDKIKLFTEYTIKEDNYKEYKWTWCGRYSVPFGLLVCNNLAGYYGIKPEGKLLCYSTSIDHPTIKVDDIGMGVTAIATLRHWVGYCVIGFR